MLKKKTAKDTVKMSNEITTKNDIKMSIAQTAMLFLRLFCFFNLLSGLLAASIGENFQTNINSQMLVNIAKQLGKLKTLEINNRTKNTNEKIMWQRKGVAAW